ncbi:unnamed protein product [Staurois parvus]|uniref:Uncharacterized protein n=1 Tax=Staurois parvus TaxID=386267 RepID=A0ABN9BYV3_9NEOB|nr:unnamed protein product [Staurois parvus]
MSMKDLTEVRSRIPVLGAENVFHRNPILSDIRDLKWEISQIPAYRFIRDLTQKKPVDIPVLSAGNVSVLIAILMNIKEFTQERSRIPVLSVGNVFHGNPFFTNISNLTRG